MNCFDHHTHTAVAICRFCGKGLCEDCSLHQQHRIRYYCSDFCLKKLTQIDQLSNDAIEMYHRNRSSLMNANKIGLLTAIFFIILAIAFIVPSWYDEAYNMMDILSYILFAFGTIYLFLNFYRGRFY